MATQSVGVTIRRRRRSRRWSTRNIVLVAIMCVVTVVMLYPFGFMLNNSFKTERQFEGAAGHSIASWRALGHAIPVGRELLNSTIVACGGSNVSKSHDKPKDPSPLGLSTAM